MKKMIMTSSNNKIGSSNDKVIQVSRQSFTANQFSFPILKRHEIEASSSSFQENSDNNKNTPIHNLPEELLSVILIRLPVKFILRCRSVQKSWYFLVRSSNFITLHLNYQKHFQNNTKFLFCFNTFNAKCTIRFDDLQCQEYFTLKFPTNFPNSPWLAQAYGLICVTSMLDDDIDQDKPDIYLWNPLIQKYKALPDSPLSTFTFDPNTHWTALAFGFVPQVNDYVVVHIVKPLLHSAPHPHSVMIGVYSLNTNSWNITSQRNVSICGISERHHIFVHGIAYWLGTSRKIIVCFDTKTNILREITLPDWVENDVTLSSPVIHPFGQSIAYFVEKFKLNHFDMWVLKGDPVNQFSWEKKISVTLTEDFRPEVLGLRNNGEPILFSLFKFISYNLDTHEANDFVDSWDHWGNFSFYEKFYAPPFDIAPFVESLVLLS